MSDRRYIVGASDIAAIMNVDPFKSATELWRQRVENDPFVGNEDTERGQMFEEPTCNWYCSKWVANVPLREVRKQVKLRHPKNDWCLATPDMVLRTVPILQTQPMLLCVDVKCPRSPSKPMKGGGYEKKWDEATQLAPLATGSRASGSRALRARRAWSARAASWLPASSSESCTVSLFRSTASCLS